MGSDLFSRLAAYVRRKVRTFAGDVLAIVGGLAALLTIGKPIYDIIYPPLPQTTDVIQQEILTHISLDHTAAVFFTVCLMLYLVLRSRINDNLVGYRDAAPHIHRFHHELRDALNLLDSHEPKNEDQTTLVLNAVFANVVGALDNLTQAFTIITGVRCAACIKFVYREEENSKFVDRVKTYARDSHSWNERKELDKKLSLEDLDRISTNTHFYELMKNSKPWILSFGSQKMMQESPYLMTAMTRLVAKPSAISVESIVYAAVSVTDRDVFQSNRPIDPTPIQEEKEQVNAFLCVDNGKRFSFTSDDEQLISSFSDALYKFVEKLMLFSTKYDSAYFQDNLDNSEG